MSEENEKNWAVRPSQLEAIHWRKLQKKLGRTSDISGEFIEATKSEVLHKAMECLSEIELSGKKVFVKVGGKDE